MPATHAVHAEEVVAAATLLYWPALQAVQEVEPGMSEYVPTAHEAQPVVPVSIALYVPAAQSTHSDPLMYVPAAQATQFKSEVEPAGLL